MTNNEICKISKYLAFYHIETGKQYFLKILKLQIINYLSRFHPNNKSIKISYILSKFRHSQYK